MRILKRCRVAACSLPLVGRGLLFREDLLQENPFRLPATLLTRGRVRYASRTSGYLSLGGRVTE
jgi:hypothetical protein